MSVSSPQFQTTVDELLTETGMLYLQLRQAQKQIVILNQQIQKLVAPVAQDSKE